MKTLVLKVVLAPALVLAVTRGADPFTCPIIARFRRTSQARRRIALRSAAQRLRDSDVRED